MDEPNGNCVKCSKYTHLDSNLAAHFIHLPFGNFVGNVHLVRLLLM